MKSHLINKFLLKILKMKIEKFSDFKAINLAETLEVFFYFLTKKLCTTYTMGLPLFHHKKFNIENYF